jgi:hypothetical protein
MKIGPCVIFEAVAATLGIVLLCVMELFTEILAQDPRGRRRATIYRCESNDDDTRHAER